MRSETPRRGEHQDLWGIRRRASSEGATSGMEGFGRRFIRPDYRLSARPSPDTPEILMLSCGVLRLAENPPEMLSAFSGT